MQTGQEHRARSPEEMANDLQAHVHAGARRYRGAVMRYLVRPPFSLKAKYAAFLIDFARQSDHMQELLGRAAERISDPELAQVLRIHQKDERQRGQLLLGDLRRLGHPQEGWPKRQTPPGDAALRGYGTTLSFERPAAMLGMLAMFIGLAAEISPSIIRLLTVGGLPRDGLRWLTAREASDPAAFRELCELVADKIRVPADQAALLEAVEVSAELLSLGAAARTPL